MLGENITFTLKHNLRLGRTPGFLIYGNGQQRRAVIEAVRLSENMRKTAQTCGVGMVGEGSSDVASDAHIYKDKSKRWQKFVTQVIFPYVQELYVYLGKTKSCLWVQGNV